ncbi:MAG: hypothetical protein AUH30_18600 [Candidatus Rokubacteria bacterium 13_1_40CM_68_15]|nr:MAG: hypothetical protein AUH30_18600 [Candidatus Rokubacteria bacterium 13_1_40CM_68_15]
MSERWTRIIEIAAVIVLLAAALGLTLFMAAAVWGQPVPRTPGAPSAPPTPAAPRSPGAPPDPAGAAAASLPDVSHALLLLNARDHRAPAIVAGLGRTFVSVSGQRLARPDADRLASVLTEALRGRELAKGSRGQLAAGLTAALTPQTSGPELERALAQVQAALAAAGLGQPALLLVDRELRRTHGRPAVSALSLGELAISDGEFALFRDLVREHTGITLGPHKRHLLRARLGRRLRALGMTTFAEYHEYLTEPEGGGAGEVIAFINAITTHKTDFFREPHHFEYVTGRWTTTWRTAAERGGKQRLRLWSAACSSGEEPYTLAMVLAEAGLTPPTWDTRILASDIDTDCLAQTENGVYPIDRVTPVPADLLKRYFLRGTGRHGAEVRMRPERLRAPDRPAHQPRRGDVADPRALPRDLLSQRPHLLRPGDAKGRARAPRVVPGAGRPALSRPRRVRLRPGRRSSARCPTT